MTEDEMKQTWCPYVRTGLTAGMSVNRHVADAPGATDGVHDETRCIGRGCSQWRWVAKDSAGFVTPTEPLNWSSHGWGPAHAIEPTRPAYITEQWHWDHLRGRWQVGEDFPDQGYCGRAGQP